MSETGTSNAKALRSSEAVRNVHGVHGVHGVHDVPQSRKPRGGNFFALDRETWEALWRFKPTNRLHFVTAYLVLLAGTGADHQFTKWSAKAIETYVGIGKPRGQKAIEELDECGFLGHAEGSTRKRPHYRLKPLDPEADPIYLPVALVTGLNGETPILRRIRETGDAYVLRMLVDLYGMVEGDVTLAPPIAQAALYPVKSRSTRKDFAIGVHTVWRMEVGRERRVAGPWCTFHRGKGRSNDAFWQRVYTLEAIGAFKWAQWVFDGADDDAEPLFPLCADTAYDSKGNATTLERLAGYASEYLKNARYPHRTHPCFDEEEEEEDNPHPSARCVRVPLPSHHRPPVVRAVLSLTVKADTPRRRIAYGERMERIKAYSEAFERIRNDASFGMVNRPLRARPVAVTPAPAAT